MWPLGSLSGSEYTPTSLIKSTSRPVSSLTSLKTADSTVSPHSTNPPGNAHDILYGSYFRLINTIESSSHSITASTVKKGVFIQSRP